MENNIENPYSLTGLVETNTESGGVSQDLLQDNAARPDAPPPYEEAVSGNAISFAGAGRGIYLRGDPPPPYSPSNDLALDMSVFEPRRTGNVRSAASLQGITPYRQLPARQRRCNKILLVIIIILFMALSFAAGILAGSIWTEHKIMAKNNNTGANSSP